MQGPNQVLKPKLNASHNFTTRKNNMFTTQQLFDNRNHSASKIYPTPSNHNPTCLNFPSFPSPRFSPPLIPHFKLQRKKTKKNDPSSNLLLLASTSPRNEFQPTPLHFHPLHLCHNSPFPPMPHPKIIFGRQLVRIRSNKIILFYHLNKSYRFKRI